MLATCLSWLGGSLAWQLASTGAAAEQADQPRYVIYYFDQPRELALNAEAVALLDHAAAPSPQRQAARRAAGLSRWTGDPITIPGWTAATTQPFRRSAAQIEQLVVQLVDADAADFVSPVFFDDFGGPLVVTPDLFVGFHGNVAPQEAEAILRAAAAGEITARDFDNLPGVYRLRGDSRNGLDVLAAANALAVLPEVSFAEPDMIFTGIADLIPNDPYFSTEWGIHNAGQATVCGAAGNNDIDMDGPEAWDVITGKPAIRVVIIDSGYQLDHPDLNHSGFGADFTGEGGGGGPVWPCDRHGTAVATLRCGNHQQQHRRRWDRPRVHGRLGAAVHPHDDRSALHGKLEQPIELDRQRLELGAEHRFGPGHQQQQRVRLHLWAHRHGVREHPGRWPGPLRFSRQ